MNFQKAQSALSFIPPHDREIWLSVGMAIKNEFGEDGFELWNTWSQGAESYKEKDAKAVWKSISASGAVGIGTLFYLASRYGWRDNVEHRSPLTAQELESKKRAQEARKEATNAEERRKQIGYEKAEKLTQTLINACALETHYYLNSKGFPDMLALVADGVLIVPMRDYKTNSLRGCQTIEWIPKNQAYEKKMIYGMRAKGSVLRLGSPRAAEIYLCEGYITGCTVEAALRRLKLNASVLVCFSSSNMAHVATMVNGKAFCAADNDHSGTGEKAAIKTGFPYAMSSIIGNDWNDDYQKFGLMHVCKMILDLRKK